MRSKRILLIFAFVLSASFANAFEVYSNDCNLSLQQLLENHNHCIKEISGDKIYLKSDKISISAEGVHLLLNEQGDFSVIPFLFTDAAGCFIQVRFSPGNDPRMGSWADGYKRTCPKCGSSYHTTCQNPNCPINKKKIELKEVKK